MSARARLAKLVLLASLALACAPPAPPPVPKTPPAPTPIAAPTASPLPLEAPPARGGVSCFVGGINAPLFSPADPSLGAAEAPVVLVEFAELQDPFATKAVATLRELHDKYGEDKLRIVWKHDPLPHHARARPAAEAAEVVFQLAGSLAFFRFHDEAFGDGGHLADDSFVRWARIAGVVDLGAFRAAYADKRFAAKIDDDLALAARLGVLGAPAFFVNGVRVEGAQSVEAFSAIIDAELAATAARRDGNTACARATANYEEKRAPEKSADDSGPFRVPIGASPTRGPATALVTIVEFSDFQCPFCKRVEPTIARVLATYGDQVRLVWKDEPLPFHPRAEPAAEVAREALRQRGVAAFWQVHDALFDAQPKLEDDDLLSLARAAKLDSGAVGLAIKNHRHRAAIELDRDLSEDVKASGTPHFFVNGRRLVGAQPFEKFKELIDLELERAKNLVAHGVAPAAVYETLQRDSAAPAGPEQRTVVAAPKAPFKGSANARVVIQEFSDFQCPFCKRVNETLAQIEKEFPGKVKIVWRHMPLAFHPLAMGAAEAAEEVRAQRGNAAFWKMHDLVFQHQSEPEGIARPALERFAAELGCDMTRFRKALDEHVHVPAIEADKKAAADAKIDGTPSFLVNGAFISGAQPIERFRRIVRRALAK